MRSVSEHRPELAEIILSMKLSMLLRIWSVPLTQLTVIRNPI